MFRLCYDGNKKYAFSFLFLFYSFLFYSFLLTFLFLFLFLFYSFLFFHSFFFFYIIFSANSSLQIRVEYVGLVCRKSIAFLLVFSFLSFNF
jgi:hypothetical protein